MDDPMSLILFVLFGILGIFIIVRIAKAASRTVDREQRQGVASVKHVNLGMTPTEVESVLGMPETKVDLTEKVLYKYKNMTVQFRDGKVSDVN